VCMSVYVSVSSRAGSKHAEGGGGEGRVTQQAVNGDQNKIYNDDDHLTSTGWPPP